MKSSALRIGTRGSALALWQARWVEGEIARRFPRCTVTIEVIRTTGDRVLDSPLASIGDRGLFTREIEHALLAGAIDCAVHSLKDLPTELPEGLSLGAACTREDVRDAFIPHPDNPVRTLLAQPPGTVIATGSLRRRSQILARRPDLATADLRGNLNTRMEKLRASRWGGIVLAYAGIRRLGWEENVGEILPTDVLLPAVGQGAIGVEIRAGDEETGGLVGALDHRPTAQAVSAERALLRRLEGGCQVPIGAYARIEGDPPMLLIDAMVASLDGATVVRGKSRSAPGEAASCGDELGRTLLAGGAGRILEEIRGAGARP